MFYIVPKEVYLQHISTLRDHVGVSHYIDLPDGTVLTKIVFTHPNAQDILERHPHVVTLPHPVTGQNVGADVSARLAHLGVTASHKTHEVAKLAAAIHPQMRLR